MAKNVTTIPATRNRFTADPISSRKKRRVAGYARVSTDMEDQQTSYAAQCDYYTRYIQSREDWEFVKLYSGEGISATSTRHRSGFNQMVEDALAGRIDLIITKSVSRFARNLPNGTLTLPSANRFLMPQVQFSEMLRLSSCASEDMMVISSSPLESNVQMFSFSKRKRRTRERFRSIMWRETTKPLYRPLFSTMCRCCCSHGEKGTVGIAA